ncbi:MAG: NupC/NupG family nucleoside CNT transporter [Pseudomonadales bacterium]
MQAIVGVIALLALAIGLGRNRQRISPRLVLMALLLQLVLAALLLRVTWISEALLWLNHLVTAVEQATLAGSSFVFGYLGGESPPFSVADPNYMYLFAFRVLPQVLVFSVLVAIAWYLGLLPWIVRQLGRLLRRTLGLTGPVATAAGASIFLGMVETPLVVRAYLRELTAEEIFTVMTCGMATVAGSIMVLYAGVLAGVLDGALGHILSASMINVIGAILMAHLLRPSNPQTPTVTSNATQTLRYSSLMDAINQGTADGLRLAVNVGAMVLVFVSLVALVNQLVGLVSVADSPLSLQRILGWGFAPIAWLIGIPWSEAQTAGSLLGTKLIINELVAYLDLAALPVEALSERSRLIMLYALCGFANFGSLGILLAGLTTLVPERRLEILQSAPWTLVSGTLATCLTGCVVSLVTSL